LTQSNSPFEVPTVRANQKPDGFYRSSKAQHRQLVFQALYHQGPISRYKLAEVLKLRYRTLRRLLSEMLHEGIIQESGNVIVRRGRAPIFLSVNPHGGRIIGIALDACEVTGVLVGLDLSLQRTSHAKIGRNSSRKAILENIHSVIAELRQSPEGRMAPLCGIGYGEYGLVDANAGVAVRSTYHRAWHDVPIKEQLQKSYGVPVSIETEERCVLLAEHIWGAIPDTQTALLIEVTSGIGFAVLDRGELFSGARGFGGELGHIRLVRDGDACPCGSRGCLETVVSTRGIIEEMRQGLRHERGGTPAGHADRVTLERVIQSAMQGDALAGHVVGKTASYLGQAAGIAINLFNPDAVLLRGEMFRVGGSWLLDTVQHEADSCVLKELKMGVRWRLSMLESAAARGAAARVFAEIFGFNLSLLPRPAVPILEKSRRTMAREGR